MTRKAGTLHTDTQQYQITVKGMVKSGKYVSDKIPFGMSMIGALLLSFFCTRLIATHNCSGV
jgi:hypothetical protein